MSPSPHTPRGPVLALLVGTAVLLTGCAGSPPPGGNPAPVDEAVELEAPQPRLAVLHQGGISVLDAETLEVIADLDHPDAQRIAPAGDGRHVMVTTADGFDVVDAGVWTEAHGDHGHSFAGPPAVTDLEFAMGGPGHVVAHDGTTALFSDGDGTVTTFPTEGLSGGAPAISTTALPEPHHGVAVPLQDGSMLVTASQGETRSSVVLLAADGTESTRTDACPDVHGEAVAGHEAVAFGCTGVLAVFEDGAFRAIAMPDPTASIGGPAGSPESEVLLADYALPGQERTDTVALIDLGSDRTTLVELPAAYYYWSLARGPHGEGVVLGTDGSLHVLDPATGMLTDSVPVIAEWEPPADWRDPAPAVTVLGHTAFVTDPSTGTLHAVDLDDAEVLGVAELPGTPSAVVGLHG